MPTFASEGVLRSNWADQPVEGETHYDVALVNIPGGLYHESELRDVIETKESQQVVPKLVRMGISGYVLAYGECGIEPCYYDVCVWVKIVDKDGEEKEVFRTYKMTQYSQPGEVSKVEITFDVDVTDHYDLAPMGLFPVIVRAKIVPGVTGLEPRLVGRGFVGWVKVYGSWGW